MDKYKKHRKDKKITILEYKEYVNDNGVEIENYEPVEGMSNIWAYYRHVSGNEFFAAHTTNTKVEVVFEINYRKGIDETMVILYNNCKYYITQIDDFEGRKTDLKIYAYKINGRD